VGDATSSKVSTDVRSVVPAFIGPARPLILHTAQDRPQPRLDVQVGRGMPVHVGRVRRCPIFGYKLVALGHNVVRGAAGAALLNAELLVARGIGLASSDGRRSGYATAEVSGA